MQKTLLFLLVEGRPRCRCMRCWTGTHLTQPGLPAGTAHAAADWETLIRTRDISLLLWTILHVCRCCLNGLPRLRCARLRSAPLHTDSLPACVYGSNACDNDMHSHPHGACTANESGTAMLVMRIKTCSNSPVRSFIVFWPQYGSWKASCNMPGALAACICAACLSEDIQCANLHIPTATGCCDVDCVECSTHPAISTMLHICAVAIDKSTMHTNPEHLRSPIRCNAFAFRHLHSFDAGSCCIISVSRPRRHCHAFSRADHARYHSACGLTIDANAISCRLVFHSKNRAAKVLDPVTHV